MCISYKAGRFSHSKTYQAFYKEAAVESQKKTKNKPPTQLHPKNTFQKPTILKPLKHYSKRSLILISIVHPSCFPKNTKF
jgi:hypothetical protein